MLKETGEEPRQKRKMAKKTEAKGKTIERTYNIPLRKEYQKVPRWKRTKKAVTALRQFLVKHMKSENVKLSKELNQKVWQHGLRNPPHHVKVNVSKDEKGEVRAELFGAKKKGEKAPKKAVEKKKTEDSKKEVKPETPILKEEKKPEAPKKD